MFPLLRQALVRTQTVLPVLGQPGPICNGHSNLHQEATARRFEDRLLDQQTAACFQGPGVLLTVNGQELILPPGNLGIPRAAMPQIKQDDWLLFLCYLDDAGVSWSDLFVPANHLMASQKELDPIKGRELAAQSPEERSTRPVIISADHYIADGHHRWLGAWYADNTSLVRVIKVWLNIQALLELCHGFDKSFRATLSKEYLEPWELVGFGQERSRFVDLLPAAQPVQLLPVGSWQPRAASLDGAAGQVAAGLTRLLRRRFDADRLAQAVGAVSGLDDAAAIAVYRALVQGGHDPRDRLEAAVMLERVLQRQPRFQGAGPDTPLLAWMDADGETRQLVTVLAGLDQPDVRQTLAVLYRDASQLTQDRLHQLPRIGQISALRELLNQTRLSWEALDQVGLAGRRRLSEMLAPLPPRAPLTLHVETTSRLAGEQRNSVLRAVRWLTEVVNLHADEKGSPLVWVRAQDSVYPRTEVQRDWAKPGEYQLLLGPNDRETAIIHGLGHVLEFVLPGARPCARQFLAYRCGPGKGGTDMGLLPGGSPLTGEIGRSGHFAAYFPGTDACYVGKQMAGPAGTELTAMLLEALYRDAPGLARGDPEACQWILGVLQGKYRRTMPGTGGVV